MCEACIHCSMDVNADALMAALKMSGQNVEQMQTTMAMLQAMRVLRDKPNDPYALMGMMAQINPKYRPMAALLRALGQNNNAEGKAENAEEPFVQRNHYEE